MDRTLEFMLTWSGSSDLDLLIPGVGYWGSKGGMVRARVTVHADTSLHLVVNSYYAAVPFELKAELVPQL